jgi:predicted esterase/ketosteroid isomerase-like protein
MNMVQPTGGETRLYLDKVYDVECMPDVTYGVGGVGYSAGKGAARHRDLKLDIYRPRAATDRPRPALIMAFGGAFHRGSKGAEVFEGENPNTAVSEYCREFARRGYVCFSIDYRLMQEYPDPGVTPFLLPGQPQSRDRIDFVRNIMGLPPSTPQMMADTLEAATDDMSKAVSFVRSRSQEFGVDISRIAIGGFSAGAAIALNSAFAERAPVAAVVALSGRIAQATMQTYLTPQMHAPAAFLCFGEHDLPVMLDGIGEMREHMTRVGIANQFATIPGANHFYLRTAEVARPDGSLADVETLIAEFLHGKLGLSMPEGFAAHEPPIATVAQSSAEALMTIERLQAFADAWNRHDIDDLMSFMTDDCAFEANAGDGLTGTSFRGKEDVRRGFMKVWQAYPDALWNNPRHFIRGDRGVSEWVFSGHSLDGQTTEVAGCDLFTFRGDKIVLKNSFRKHRL